MVEEKYSNWNWNVVGNCDGLQCLVYNLAKSKKALGIVEASTEEKPIAAKKQ